MINGGWNAVSLAKDRTVYFDKDNLGRYGDYDLNILENSDEVFDRVILLIYEPSKIEDSMGRKTYLLENMFAEIKTPDPAIQSTLSPSNVNEQSLELTD